MKNLLTLLTIILGTFTFSQEIAFEDVVKVDSTTTKDELYNRARTWVSKAFKDEKYVMSIEDRATGEISGNGTFKYVPTKMYYGARMTQGYVNFKFNIYVKDGRYKFRFDSFSHEGTRLGQAWDISYGTLTESEKAPKPSHEEPYDKAWKDIKDQTTKKMNTLILYLKESMSKKYEGSEDW